MEYSQNAPRNPCLEVRAGCPQHPLQILDEAPQIAPLLDPEPEPHRILLYRFQRLCAEAQGLGLLPATRLHAWAAAHKYFSYLRIFPDMSSAQLFKTAAGSGFGALPASFDT